MKKIVGSLCLVLGIFSVVCAQSQGPDSFRVEVKPAYFMPNEAVDVTVTAMRNGMPHTTFTGFVYLFIPGLDFQEYVLSSERRYQFVPEDL